MPPAKERRRAEQSGHGQAVGDHHRDNSLLVVKNMMGLKGFGLKSFYFLDVPLKLHVVYLHQNEEKSNDKMQYSSRCSCSTSLGEQQ